MKSYRRSMPPLDCLVFFEAAARHLSFTKAASELFVTQAAVSKRIHQLEQSLSIQLFTRKGRHLSLTAEGETLQNSVVMAMGYLEKSLQSLSAPENNAVSISANNAVSMFWLQPRLKIFGLSDDACALNLIVTDNMNDQLSAETDLAIIYCDEDEPGWQSTAILEERLVPVAAPSLIERLSLSPQSRLLDVVTDGQPTLLNYPRTGPESNNWDTWIEKMGLLEIAAWPRKECTTYAQSIGLALEGDGVALASVALIENEIRSGQLRRLSDDVLTSTRKYYLAFPHTRPLRENTRQVYEFLIEQANQQMEGAMGQGNKERICALLKSIETGDPGPTAVVNEAKYIQHNPQTKEGSEGLAALFKRLSETNPRVNIVRAFEDGDFVFAHTEYDFSKRNIGFEVFHFEDGQAVEHWDNIQPRLGPNPSGRSMVDGPTDVTDHGLTEENRALVRSFVETVLIDGQLDRLVNFIAGEEFLEHNPALTDGASSLRTAMSQEEDGRKVVNYQKLHRVLADGNFVLSVSEGERASVHTSFYDLFRVESGKLAEHWDTTEKIAPKSEWKNDNGKF